VWEQFSSKHDGVTTTRLEKSWEVEEEEFFRLLHCSPFSSSVYCSHDVEASFVDWLLCVLSSVTLSLYICFLVCRSWGPGFLFTVFRYLGGERERERAAGVLLLLLSSEQAVMQFAGLLRA
jgi:hypothetical protein